MNIRGVLVILCVFIFALSFVSAANETNGSAAVSAPAATDASSRTARAYQCLQNQIDTKTASAISLQEAIFGTLALGSNSKTLAKIDEERGSDCWPKSACTIKETAQAMLALRQAGRNTAPVKTWLESKTGLATGLSWYLQIDIANQQASSCKIKSGSTEQTFTVGTDMRISGPASSCLSVVSSGYWLQVSQSCFDRTFQISCDKDFVTTLHFTRAGSDTLYVSPQPHAAASLGTTTETINAKCFRQNSNCDYEGTLWAAAALAKIDANVSAYIPYLVALSADNEQFFPASLLYTLTKNDVHYSEVVQSQKSNQYWEAPTTRYNRLYDTSLGLLALQGTSAAEADNARNYLLSIQTSDGCWNNNNIRDTGFLLYAGWPRAASSGSGSGASDALCEIPGSGQSCEPVLACQNAGGQVLYNFQCSGLLRCCSLKVAEQTCAEQQGSQCSASQQCSGREVPSAEGTCCLGTCQEVQQQNMCEAAGGMCRSSCGSSEISTADQCTSFSEVCCAPKPADSSGSSAWIWILILLIILVVLAIIFRKRLQMLWFKFRKRRSAAATPIVMRRPPFPPAGAQRAPQYRAPAQPVRRSSPADKEMEETLKKLKEMAK